MQNGAWRRGAYAVIRCQEGGSALSREGCRATPATFLPRAAFPSGAAVTVPRLPGRRDPSAVPAPSLPSVCQGWAGRCRARSLPGFRARARTPSPRVPLPARARAPRRPVPAVSLSCPPAAIARRAARPLLGPGQPKSPPPLPPRRRPPGGNAVL